MREDDEGASLHQSTADVAEATKGRAFPTCQAPAAPGGQAGFLRPRGVQGRGDSGTGCLWQRLFTSTVLSQGSEDGDESRGS